MVGRVTPNSWAMCSTVCARLPSGPFSSYISRASFTWRGPIFGFWPPVRPRARAAARPSRVRSDIRACLNSAIEPRIWKNIRPMAVVVSMPWSRTTRSTHGNVAGEGLLCWVPVFGKLPRGDFARRWNVGLGRIRQKGRLPDPSVLWKGRGFAQESVSQSRPGIGTTRRYHWSKSDSLTNPSAALSLACRGPLEPLIPFSPGKREGLDTRHSFTHPIKY